MEFITSNVHFTQIKNFDRIYIPQVGIFYPTSSLNYFIIERDIALVAMQKK